MHNGDFIYEKSRFKGKQVILSFHFRSTRPLIPLR